MIDVQRDEAGYWIYQDGRCRMHIESVDQALDLADALTKWASREPS